MMHLSLEQLGLYYTHGFYINNRVLLATENNAVYVVVLNVPKALCFKMIRLLNKVCYLTRWAGQWHSSFQLPQDLFLQRVQPFSITSSSRNISIHLVTFSIHQVVVNADQGFIMGLLKCRINNFCNGCENLLNIKLH